MRPHSGYSIPAGWLRRIGWSVGISAILLQTATAQDAGCTPETIGSARVAAVRDGRSLLLDDAREVRLAGIETPLSGDGAEPARAALVQLVDGRTVTLKRAAPGSDRYGRTLAYVYVAEGNPSAQEALLAQGHARVSPNAERACMALLLSQERVARTARRGLWAENAAFPRETSDSDALTAAKGRFAVLEGTVVSVRESRGVVYMNFGRRISRDFTVTILKRNERIFTAANLEPKKLEGRRVRVRGWIEQRRGPVIEATRPEQIELVELN